MTGSLIASLVAAFGGGWVLRDVLASFKRRQVAENPPTEEAPESDPADPQLVNTAVGQARVVEAERELHAEQDPGGRPAYDYLAGRAYQAMRRTVLGGDD